MALAGSRLVLELARLRSAPTSFAILPFSTNPTGVSADASSPSYRRDTVCQPSPREARGHDSDRRFESHLESADRQYFSVLPARPSVSDFATNTCVPSICMYKCG